MLELLFDEAAKIMGLGRLLTILILIWLGYLIYKRLIAPGRKQHKPRRKTIENMVRCAHCQMHIPEHEALLSDGRYYCSQQHLDLDQNDKK